MYSAEAMDHFLNPRNVGQLAAADGRGEATNHDCGDTALFTVTVADGAVTAAQFASQSCAGGIACCSMATEWATGRAIVEVMSLTARDLADALGGLPDAKLGCAEMAVGALHEAVRAAQG